jgi:hypothetical protein
MNRPDDELARKIVQHLDYGADHLDREKRERLLSARKLALSNYKQRPQPVWGLAWAGYGVGGQSGHRASRASYVLAAAALLAALAGIAYWQSPPRPANDATEIELGLLTGDLPINAYLDKGFDSWLKRSQR